MTLSGTPRAQARAMARWSAVADRFRSVSPSALGRGSLAFALVAAGAWLSLVTWPALLPFLIGGVIAYIVLPVANGLDRFMPRVLASLLAELLALGVLAGVVLVVVPPLLRSIVRVALLLPTGEEVTAQLTQMQAELGELPEPMRSILVSVATQVTDGLTTALRGLVEGAGAFVTQQILGILGTVTVVLGLLVIPAWILTVVADEQTIKRRATGFISPAIRTDLVAGFRIVDRALATFLRTQVLIALATGVLTWVGLEVVQGLGVAEFPYAVAGAVTVGALQLIPQLGFFLGLLPIALVAVLSGPVPALAALGVYALSARLSYGLVQTRTRGVLNVHAALLIPALVVLSEFGLIWLLIAAPAIVIIRDLARYIAARLDDPPAPAGVLPGERSRGAVAAPPAAAVPSVYRDRPGPRPAAGVPITTAARSSQP